MQMEAFQQGQLDSLHKIADLFPGVVFQFRMQTDGRFCFPFVSQRAFKLLRLNPDRIQIDASEVFANVFPDDLEELIASIQSSANELTPWKHEFRVGAGKDEVRWLFGNAMPQREASGSVLWHGFVTDITERMRVEETLRTSEQRLKLAIGSGQVGVWDLDLRTNELLWDETMFALYGARREDFTGAFEAWSSRLHPEDRAATMKALQDAVAGVGVYEPEFRVVWPNHEVRYLKGRAEVVRDKEGAPLRMIGTNWDNRALVQTQQQLKLMSAAINKSRISIFLINPGGKVSFVNDYACTTLGYSRSELVGQDISFFDPYFNPDSWPERWISIKEGKIKTFVANHKRKDGAILPVEITTSYIAVDGEEYAFSLAQDVTDRMEREAQSRKIFIENETILSHAMVGIAYIKHRRIVSCNKRFEEMFQYDHGELLGMSTEMLYDSRETYDRIGAEGYKAATKGDGYFGEVKLRHKDGSEFWGTLSGKSVDPDHPHEGSIWVYSDINARKFAEEELRIAASAFDSQESLMITDANEVILRVNKAFTLSTGYSAEEVVGKTPRIFKSGRHDADFYRKMWECINASGKWQGEVWDRRKNGDIFPKLLTISAVTGNDGVVTHYVGSHIDITEQKAVEEKIQTLAFYDPLTGLPNRRLLSDRLQRALVTCSRHGGSGAVLFIDLDNFKTINDTLGHSMGDFLLQQTALRLTSCVREGDTVARIGGDEFVVMLENLDEDEIEAATQTEIVADKILAVLSESYQIATHKYHGTCSIGIAIFNDRLQSIDELLQQADIAMYQAKSSGRNAKRFFDKQMQEIVFERATLEEELRKAIENQEFQLYYQIQTNDAQQAVGAEALIRWIHPSRGVVYPGQFIALAEDTGLILPIGQWVLETACAQLKAWQSDELTRDFILSFNISARQFRQSGFVEQVQAAVLRHAIDPGLLKLELTESTLLENIEDTIETMNALKGIGVRFTLDDFGTGYSSLQYLKLLPLDQLKIDQSFVRDLAVDSNDRAIVRTIIAMAHSMNLGVIAEGVETEEQLQLLVKKGCTHFQGYLFGKPIPINQFELQVKRLKILGLMGKRLSDA